MIDFNSEGFFARLKKVNSSSFGRVIDDIMIDGECVIGAYQSVRDGVVFTNKRIIAINVQGISGKKQDYTSIPYSKISTFSLETAGLLDLDSELEIYLSGVGKVKFQFTQSTDVKEICRAISTYTLGEVPYAPQPVQAQPVQTQPTTPQSASAGDATKLNIKSLFK